MTSDLTAVIDEKMKKLDVITQRCDNMEDNIHKNSDDIALLFQENQELKEELAEQIDRGMRSNLTVAGVGKLPQERTWDDTRAALASELAKISVPEKSAQYWIAAIDRAHRAPRAPAGKTLVINAKFKFYDDVEYLLELFKKPNTKYTFQVYQQFSERTSERRKKALALRKQMKDADKLIKGYVKYPAILRIKKPSDSDYQTVATF